jgi:predicted component of type VI protein secretion system
MTTTYRLVLQSGAGAGTEYPLEKTDLFLGRDMSNDIVVNDPEVSRKHAHLVLEGATYRLEDLGSTNGTFIRGQRLSAPVLLRPGEIITIGEKVVLRFDVFMSDPNATVAVQRGANQNTQVPRQPVTPQIPLAPPATPPSQVYQPVTPPQAPSQSVAPYAVQPPQAAKKISKAVLILLIVAGVIVLFCIIPWILIEVTNSYCSLFPGVFNALMTGACP